MVERTFIERLHWRLFRLLPRVVNNPILKSLQKNSDEEDAEKNDKCTPEDNDNVDLSCFWAIEFYNPSHVGELPAAFKRLGWTGGKNRRPLFDVVEWLKENRGETLGGGWFRLNTLVSHEKLGSYTDSVEANLPDGVSYATAALTCLGSSLACIAVCFKLEEHTSQEFERVIRRKYRTVFRKQGTALAIIDPLKQKQDKLTDIRRNIDLNVQQWFAENIPGVFSSKTSTAKMPTCELLVFNANNIALNSTPSPVSRRLDSRFLLGLSSGALSELESQQFTGLRFTTSVIRNPTINSYASMYIGLNDLNKVDVSQYGREHVDVKIQKLCEGSEAFLIRWACLVLVRMLNIRVNDLRDSQIFTSNRTDTNLLIQELRKITANSLDVNFIIPDIIYSLSSPFTDSDIDQFTTKSPPWIAAAPISALPGMNENIRKEAENLLVRDKMLRELLSQQGSLASVAENIKVQRKLNSLTWAIAGFTIVSVIIAGVSAYPVLFGK